VIRSWWHVLADEAAYWRSRAACALFGHDEAPGPFTFATVCRRPACRGRTI
jgi:hypothetical protein